MNFIHKWQKVKRNTIANVFNHRRFVRKDYYEPDDKVPLNQGVNFVE